MELARTRLAHDPDPDRATVVLHIDASALSGGPGACKIAGGPSTSLETAMRLACDARVQLVADGPDGYPIGVGTTARSVPPWLMRLLVQRDEDCRWPGCGCRRLLHGHHIAHREHGGATALENLALLCTEHHRFLHERGWRIEGDPAGKLRFVGPDGRELTSRPPGLRPEIRERLIGTSNGKRSRASERRPERDGRPPAPDTEPYGVPTRKRSFLPLE